MKKAILFLLALMALLIFVQFSKAATETVAASAKWIVGAKNNGYTYEYTFENIPGEDSKRYKIPVPFVSGNVIQTSWDSISDDCFVGVYMKDDQIAGSVYNVVEFTAENGYSPDHRPRWYRNLATVEELYLYALVQNDDTDNTTDAKLTLTFMPE